MFIAVDGIDGAGKSTLVRGLFTALRRMNPLQTKEPTANSPWGRKLRSSAKSGRLSRIVETEYFHLDRLAHIRNVIEPALKEKRIVITDRYVDSTLAFQTENPEEADKLYKQFAVDLLVPDITFILDCPVDVGLARIKRARPSLSEFEKPLVLDRARRIYASRKGPNYVHIDALRRPDQVLEFALNTLVSRFPDVHVERDHTPLAIERLRAVAGS
jgi:dTMP kinase